MSKSLNCVFSCGDGIAVAEISRVCVVIWRDEVTPARFARQRAGLAEVVAAHRHTAGFLCIVEPQVPPPSPELRQASTKMLEGHERELKCVAGVIEASGFMAALTRSVLSSMTLFRAKVPTYFADVPAACAWMAQRLDLDPGDFVADVEALRAQLTQSGS